MERFAKIYLVRPPADFSDGYVTEVYNDMHIDFCKNPAEGMENSVACNADDAMTLAGLGWEVLGVYSQFDFRIKRGEERGD